MDHCEDCEKEVKERDVIYCDKCDAFVCAQCYDDHLVDAHH
jgi:hypothetical protein